MENKESMLIEVASHEGGQFSKVSIIQRESTFAAIRDSYKVITVYGYSPVVKEVVESLAWLVQGIAVHAAKFSSGNIYLFGRDNPYDFSGADALDIDGAKILVKKID